MQTLDETKADATRGPMVDPRAYGLAKAAYTLAETIVILSIGRTSLYKLMADGSLKPVKMGKKTLFYASDIAMFLANLRATS
jgi:predicted DNA-binding transcriptional regulator AlpA